MSDSSYESIEEFRKEREKLNEIVLNQDDINIKRFFNLDTKVYKDGALPAKIKEMLGLVSSLVLGCDDCILYHLIRCYEEGVTSEEINEVVDIGMLVGGSITIPHVRKLYKKWEQLKKKEK